MNAASLTVEDLDISAMADQEAFNAQLAKVDAAIQTVSDTRASLGANQNRLDTQSIT